MNRGISEAISAVNAESPEIWLMERPAPLVGVLTVVVIAGLAVLGLVLSRRIISAERLQGIAASEQIFSLAGVLYAVLVAFVVVVVWEQFDQARTDAESEAAAIAALLRDSEGLPAASQPAIQQSLIAYTNDVVNDEFPRMRGGEPIKQQSDNLTRVWQSYLHVQPVTESEGSFYRESVAKLDDLGSARKTRIASSKAEIPGLLWVLLVGGGIIMLAFGYIFGPADIMVHSVLIGLAGALLAFVLFLIFDLNHPFVGTISVGADPYAQVLDAWAHSAPK